MLLEWMAYLFKKTNIKEEVVEKDYLIGDRLIRIIDFI